MVDGKDFDSEFEVIRVRNTGSKNITDAVASKADGRISGLSEKQIDSLINCKKDEKAMATIIEIAIMLNKKGDS